MCFKLVFIHVLLQLMERPSTNLEASFGPGQAHSWMAVGVELVFSQEQVLLSRSHFWHGGSNFGMGAPILAWGLQFWHGGSNFATEFKCLLALCCPS
jgi:hypothetical protein